MKAFLFSLLVKMLEHQMEVREKEVQALQSQALALSQEDAGLAEVDGQQRRVTDTFSSLQEPLQQRRQQLLASKEAHQFNRDLEDEIVSRFPPIELQHGQVQCFYCELTILSVRCFCQLWVKERMPLAASTDHGKDLPTVQLLIKKNQVRWSLAPSCSIFSYRIVPLKACKICMLEINRIE